MTKIKSVRIEVAGLPGSGKTTLVQDLARSLRELGTVDVDPVYRGVGSAISVLQPVSPPESGKALRYRFVYARALWGGLGLHYPRSTDFSGRWFTAKRVARKSVRSLRRQETGNSKFLVPDTSLASFVAPFLTKSEPLNHLSWDVDLLVVLEVDYQLAFERIQARARPGDKYRAQDLLEFEQMALRTQVGLEVLRTFQKNLRRPVLSNPESVREIVRAIRNLSR